MKHIITFKQAVLVGGFGVLLASGLAGCGDGRASSNDAGGAAGGQSAAVKQGATVFIEKTANGYKVVDEFPSAQTRVFLREEVGGQMQERLLSQSELDALMAEENAKIDAGKSELTDASLSSGGMSLGSAILASAAGAMIGSWIGNKLFNSPGYQAQRQAAYSNPSAYQRSVNSFGQNARAGAAGAGSGAKSGFFGQKSGAGAAGASGAARSSSGFGA